MTVSTRTKIILAMRSGDRCALPDCGRSLTRDAETGTTLTVGEAAHIAGSRPSSARHDPNMGDPERNHFDNLLYVCANCHKLVDQDVDSYPVERLRKLKAEHEAAVQAGMDAAFATVGIPELEKLVDQFSLFPPVPADPSLALLPPEAKIRKNDLGPRSQHRITAGLALSATIRRFVSTLESEDPDWPHRLRAGFVTEYLRLREEGQRGDDLFDAMCAFSTRGFHEPSTQVAAISVLVYMFEACEVFER